MNTEQPTIKEILSGLFSEGYDQQEDFYGVEAINSAAHQLLDYLLALPELQDSGHICRDVDCPRRVDIRNRQDIRQALTRAILGEGEGK